MSSRRTNSPKIELKLNLSPARTSNNRHGSNVSSRSTSPKSEGSCVSGGPDNVMMMHNGGQEVTSPPMVLVGCPRCLMYVMLSEVNPQCPLCKSTVLLDFVNGDVHGHKKD